MHSLKVRATLKRKATDYQEAPPCQILKDLANVPEPVAAHLPNLPSLTRTIQRHRAATLPMNAQSIEDLEGIPRQFSVTKSNEPFLLYDSLNDEEDELTCGRIIIFATEMNLKNLIKSRRWYVDGTFKTAPAIFYQLFTILGCCSYLLGGKPASIILPLIYALLESQEEAAYRKVFEVTLSAAQSFEIPYEIPFYVMCDFEIAIINAILSTIGDVIRACFFHLCQSIWRRIQADGLAAAYNDPQDRSIRDAARKLCALAFVPLHDVESVFLEFKASAPQNFGPVTDYFQVICSKYKYFLKTFIQAISS